MRYIFPALIVAVLVTVVGFKPNASHKIADNNTPVIALETVDAMHNDAEAAVTTVVVAEPVSQTDDQSVAVDEQAVSFVNYAKTLIGTPYVYGSVDPSKGLDCSGFVNCVSNHFGIKVPRSSVDFTNVGTAIETSEAKPGDLILFTGTDASKRVVGHIGIVTGNENGELEFIHSSSGKAQGVTISELSDHYKERLMKVIRIFPISGDKVVA